MDRTKLLIGLFILLVTVGLGIWQFSTLTALKISTETLGTQSANLTVSKNALIDIYQSVKVDTTSVRETAAQDLALVFPTEEDLTTLTRALDDFAVKNNFENNPFFISSLSYDDPVLLEEENYRYTSFTVDITTSKKNLSKFLEFIENSGSLEAQSRLMSVQDLRITYPEEFGGTYEVQLEIYAYFSQPI